MKEDLLRRQIELFPWNTDMGRILMNSDHTDYDLNDTFRSSQ
jgi:hypothetical protein